MRRWRRLGLSTKAVVEFNAEPIKKINKAFRGVRTDAGLGADVLRHTAITWTAQRGVLKHEICGFFGITEEMFDRVYDKHTGQATRGTRDPDAILIDDVLALYVRDKVADQARPDETAKRVEFLKAFWEGSSSRT
jgi:hypothetical protein